MIAKFKEAMISYFEMTSLALMLYFLDIEVIQQDDEIFISQKKYVGDIMEKFKMENSKPISTPVREKLMLTKESDRKMVDTTL